VPYTAARREVGRLEGFGILRSEQIGRSKRFHLVEGSPLLPGLRELVRRTVGLIPELERKLADEPAEVAFVFGSLALGQDTGESDVDLLVVGDVDPVRLSRMCAELEGELGREVNLVSFGVEEFRERMRAPSSFLSSVLRQPRIFLRGDDDALRRLAQEPADSP
jgi:predicted nucleotidyltransferase